MNIILAGMPGCGKTTVAKKLAASLGYGAVDTDELIVREHGEIAKIFEEHGEAYFRKLEHETVKKISSADKTVIATGGGCLMNEQNVKLFKSGGKIVYLKTSVDELLKRLKGDTARPLLAGDLAENLNRLYNKRASIYVSAADITVITDGKTVEETIKRITESLK